MYTQTSGTGHIQTRNDFSSSGQTKSADHASVKRTVFHWPAIPDVRWYLEVITFRSQETYNAEISGNKRKEEEAAAAGKETSNCLRQKSNYFLSFFLDAVYLPAFEFNAFRVSLSGGYAVCVQLIM